MTLTGNPLCCPGRDSRVVSAAVHRSRRAGVGPHCADPAPRSSHPAPPECTRCAHRDYTCQARKPGQVGLQIRTHPRGCPQHTATHTIGALRAPGEAAPAGPILLTEHPVGVHRDRQPLGHLCELIWPQLGRFLGQEPFGGLSQIRTDLARQLLKEPRDHPQMLPIQEPAIPYRGGGRQVRLHWLARQRDPLAEQVGVPQPAARLRQADAQGIGDHLERPIPQRLDVLIGQGGGYLVAVSGQPPAARLQRLHHGQPVSDDQCLPVAARHGIQSIQAAGDLRHRVGHPNRNRMHVRMITPRDDITGAPNTACGQTTNWGYSGPL